MNNTWPIGAQYWKYAGKGSLAGMAGDVLKAVASAAFEASAAGYARRIRSETLYQFKREQKEAGYVKKETAAMKAIFLFVRRNPGSRRPAILHKAFPATMSVGKSTIDSALNELVARKKIQFSGSIGHRAYSEVVK